MFCGPEGVGVRGFQPETPTRRDGPEKIPVVTKSISLQEMRQRPSLRDISECEVSGEGGNSSGVFTCSVDISDVCMADLTKLSDSTVCSSSSESISRSTLQLNRDPATPNLLSSAVMSTPLAPHLHSITSSGILTPIRSQSDFLSPQFGASDDYLRRNIKFIYKQLGSLMTQLRTEDKYFQTCSQRYEEVIANLEDEIVALKSANIVNFTNVPALDQPADENKIESPNNGQNPVRETSSETETANEQDAKYILWRISHDILPQLRAMVLSASENLPGNTDKPWDCKLDSKEDVNFKTLPSIFDKCLAQLDAILKAFNGAHSSLSSEFQDVSNRMENTKLTDSGTGSLSSFHEDLCAKKQISDLENKVSELEALNASLKSECLVSREEITRINAQNAVERETSPEFNGETSQSSEMLRSEVEKMTHSLAEVKDKFDKVTDELECKSLAYEGLLSETYSEKAEVERQVTVTSLELSKTKRELNGFVEENSWLEESVSSKDQAIAILEEKRKKLETEHKSVVEEFRIKGSSLILENSKLKEELGKLHKAFDEAHVATERSTEKFNDLQKIYESLIARMEFKEREFAELEIQKGNLEGLLKANDAVLCRLCSNFNELLAIFRECQDLGLDRDSSATDIDDGFIRLKRRLLDLSQDYITLNNRNKVLEKEALVMTNKLKEKEHEVVSIRKKYETKCEKLQRTLEQLEDENKVLVSQKIEQDNALRKMKSKLKDLELQEAKGYNINYYVNIT